MKKILLRGLVERRRKEAAGARVLRNLLRIETSDRELYAKIHPADCSFARRVACIRTLKRLGYVTDSGVMIGLPGRDGGASSRARHVPRVSARSAGSSAASR